VPEKKKSMPRQWAESFRCEGPLGQAGLGRWRQRRVRVVVRRLYGMRGWYEGRLVTYDRHWNMVLKDVTEQTVVAHPLPSCAGEAEAHVRPRGGGIGRGGPSVGSGSGSLGTPVSPPATAWKGASIPLLLLRGQAVVSVCDARKAADAAAGGQSCRRDRTHAHAVGGAGGSGLIAAAFERLGLTALEMARKASEQGWAHEVG
jgi:small nuclear ribonucleoprotein (snRNP)-like protein